MKNFTEFNKQAPDYAKYRPSYPLAVFEYLSSLTLEKKLAYDVGTGNGQCAVALVNYFDQVMASDLSLEQIQNAIQKDRVSYFVSESHESKIADHSVDLITVATAIHWFDFDKFYRECKRILKPGGILAAWSYGWHQSEKPEVTNIMNQVGKEILNTYWSPQPKLIWTEYKTIPFPFEELTPPTFTQETNWNLEEFVGYMTTWSATQKYLSSTGKHPVDSLFSELQEAWGDPEKKLKFQSPLYMRVGKV